MLSSLLPSEGPLVKIRDLRLNFNTFDGVSKVLAGVNLTVEKGDVLGLVGETGCGKTMTALSIPRLIPCPPGEIVGGEILFEGEDVLAKSEDEMRELRASRIAMIFQDPTTNLNPVFTIEEQMIDAILCRMGEQSALGLTPFSRWQGSVREKRTEARHKAVEMLKRVGISQVEDRIGSYPHEFSGGMRQRVLIAMAMAGQPHLLIADEPTTALDVSIQAQILRLVKELVDEFHLSVLLITHNLGVVAKICNKVAVMYAGRVVETGTIREIFKAPKHPYTVGLLNAIPTRASRRGELQGIPGSIPNLLSPPAGCRFHPRCAHAMPQCAADPAPGMIPLTRTHQVVCHLFD
ncbi:MAG: ABC transporter ATP-binding protein [Chloroflexi bacterium]|nr:ABC transporter ATP-binding protein [Chloroflexota bacterium]